MLIDIVSKAFEQNSLFPNSNWYNDNRLVIDETTEQGKQMAQTYIDNYPFVDFEYDGEFITKVIVLDEQREQERIDKELLDSLIPSEREMLMAEVEIQTITILMEVGLI